MTAATIHAGWRGHVRRIFAYRAVRNERTAVTSLAQHRRRNGVRKRRRHPRIRRRDAMTTDALRSRRHRQMRRGFIGQMTRIATGCLSGVIKRNVQVPRGSALMAHTAIHAGGRRDVSGSFTNGATGNELPVVTSVATRRRHASVIKRRRSPAGWWRNVVTQDALSPSGHRNVSRAGRFIFYVASITTSGQAGVIESNVEIPRHHTLVTTVAIHTSGNRRMRWCFARNTSNYPAMATLAALRRHLAVIECRGRRPARWRWNVMTKIAL